MTLRERSSSYLRRDVASRLAPRSICGAWFDRNNPLARCGWVRADRGLVSTSSHGGLDRDRPDCVRIARGRAVFKARDSSRRGPHTTLIMNDPVRSRCADAMYARGSSEGDAQHRQQNQDERQDDENRIASSTLSRLSSSSKHLAPRTDQEFLARRLTWPSCSSLGRGIVWGFGIVKLVDRARRSSRSSTFLVNRMSW